MGKVVQLAALKIWGSARVLDTPTVFRIPFFFRIRLVFVLSHCKESPLRAAPSVHLNERSKYTTHIAQRRNSMHILLGSTFHQ